MKILDAWRRAFQLRTPVIPQTPEPAFEDDMTRIHQLRDEIEHQLRAANDPDLTRACIQRAHEKLPESATR